LDESSPIPAELLQEKLSKWDIIVLSLRYYLDQLGKAKKKIGNYELCGWISAFILTLDQNIKRKELLPKQCSLIGLNQLIHLDTILYCLSFLLPLYQPYQLCDFWSLLDGPIFQWTIQQAKRGSSPRQLLRKNETGIEIRMSKFMELNQRVSDGYQNIIEIVIDYDQY
jgi:hypothetical protein